MLLVFWADCSRLLISAVASDKADCWGVLKFQPRPAFCARIWSSGYNMTSETTREMARVRQGRVEAYWVVK